MLGASAVAPPPRAFAASRTRRAAGNEGLYPEVFPVVIAAPSGLEMLGEGLAGLAALYVIMSLNEYIYHRYFQHLGINKLDIARVLRKSSNLDTYKGDGHVEHHRETLDDMTLDFRRQPDLDADPWRGTAFPWWAYGAMTVSVMGPSIPVLLALGWSAAAIAVGVPSAVLVHTLAWNALHPNMHGLPDVPLTHGPPSGPMACLRGSWYFEWLRKNHEGHHRTEGAHGNYNVCLPLMDQLAGTYVGEVPAAPLEVQEVVRSGARA